MSTPTLAPPARTQDNRALIASGRLTQRTLGVRAAARLRLERRHTPAEEAAQVALIAQLCVAGPDEHEQIDIEITDLLTKGR